MRYADAAWRHGEAALPDSPFFAADELKAFGFSDVGDNIQVSRKCSFYRISGRIGSNVRIDDFCIFKGHVEIGSYFHVAAFCSVSGAFAKVELKDFCTLSNRVSIFTGSDDYLADTLNNSQVPDEFTTIKKGSVVIGQAVLIGAHSVILPGVTIGDAGSVGAMAVVTKSIGPGEMARATAAVAVVGGRKRDAGKIMAMAKDFRRARRKNDRL